MSINAQEYENLQIKGPIGVVPIIPGELEKNEGTVRVHILMGPTGAGKSAPITDIRIGGSKRGAVKLLRAFAASFNAVVITVVTTMWNNVSTPKQIEDANQRFSSLSHEIFKGTSTMEIDVGKFEPTMGSALSVLNTAAAGWFYSTQRGGSSAPQYQVLICSNLLDRIAGVLQQLEILAADKKVAMAPGKENPALLTLVLRDEEVALATIQSFVDDLVGMGSGGIMALQSLLDARYEADANACLSTWEPTVAGSRQDTLTVSHSPATHPAPSPTSLRRSLSSQMKAVISPLKYAFEWFDPNFNLNQPSLLLTSMINTHNTLDHISDIYIVLDLSERPNVRVKSPLLRRVKHEELSRQGWLVQGVLWGKGFHIESGRDNMKRLDSIKLVVVALPFTIPINKSLPRGKQHVRSDTLHQALGSDTIRNQPVVFSYGIIKPLAIGGVCHERRTATPNSPWCQAFVPPPHTTSPTATLSLFLVAQLRPSHSQHMMETPSFNHLPIAGDISIKAYHRSNGYGSKWRKFIEALAGPHHSLSLAKDQLAGYTQRAAAYQLINPILHICRIGMDETKRGTIEVFVTSMWDTVQHEHARNHAESNFAQQLRKEVFKDFSRGGKLMKSPNTPDSIL
ncbi:hypothetical protein BJ165DRAFT_1581046 [Panaeolus papilionaceus]|nr:hypothetical protein BJ165DRAFT_1581046 [Panaeolus papilionaceus]